MNYDDDTMSNSMDLRRESIRKTIKPITLAELKELGEKQFPIVTDPWCGRYFDFLAKHADDKFYQATSAEGARVIYSKDAGQGVWFLPGGGKGILQPKGLQALKEIVAAL
jgi:hypothetical protein